MKWGLASSAGSDVEGYCVFFFCFCFFFFFFMKWGLASSAGSDMPREIAWYADVCGFGSLIWIGHEIISRVILPVLLFRVGQLSITGLKMYTKYWFIS